MCGAPKFSQEEGVQLQTRVGPKSFTISKTHNVENQGGGGGGGVQTPSLHSGSEHVGSDQ